MRNKCYNELFERIDKLEGKLEKHEYREIELLRLINIECKYRNFYSKYITLDDCCSLIPFDIFDLSINGTLYHRACTKEYLPKLLLNSCYGFNFYYDNTSHITDVRISLKESLVDLIID